MTADALVDLILTTETHKCQAYAYLHRVDMHDEHGLIVDIEMAPSQAWDALHHAMCTRCGWKSQQAWFADDFPKPPAQNYIAGHRDQWTGECIPDSNR